MRRLNECMLGEVRINYTLWSRRYFLIVMAITLGFMTVADAAGRRCADGGGVLKYLSQPVNGMTPDAIADTFISDYVLPDTDGSIRAYWKEFSASPGNIDGLVNGWNVDQATKTAVLDRKQFIELLYQLRNTIMVFEGTRQSARQAAELMAGDWSDWRAKHMSRDDFIRQYQAEAEKLQNQGLAPYGAVLQSAQYMRNRLDDLHGAAGFRDPIDDLAQMWMWDSWIRQKAADVEVQKLKASTEGYGYLNDYLLARKSTIKCVAAGLEESSGHEMAKAPPISASDLALYRRPHIVGPLTSGNSVEINDESMGYLSGFLELYLPNCQWHGTSDQLLSVTQFYQATVQRALTYASNLKTVVQDSVLFGAAANDGKADFQRFQERTECRGQIAENIAAGLIRTVQVTGSAEKKETRFMWSCIRSRLTEEQCACLMELGRGADPDIENTFYYRNSTIKNLVAKNPFLAGQISIQCGIGEY